MTGTYWAPGHAPLALEDSEYVDFSPTKEFKEVIDHVKSQGAERREQVHHSGVADTPFRRRQITSPLISARRLRPQTSRGASRECGSPMNATLSPAAQARERPLSLLADATIGIGAKR